MSKTLSELVAEIVLAQAQRRDFNPNEISEFSIHTAQAFRIIQDVERGGDFPIEGDDKETSKAKSTIMENPLDSISDDSVTCLECGSIFKQLSYKHLQTHNLTPEEYRAKYGFSKKQPLIARSVSEERGNRMKLSGLVDKMQSARQAKIKELKQESV